MEDVTLLEPTWQEEKNRDEIIEEEDQTEEKDDLDVKDELWSSPQFKVPVAEFVDLVHRALNSQKLVTRALKSPNYGFTSVRQQCI